MEETKELETQENEEVDAEELEQLAESDLLVEEAFGLSLDEFTRMKAADRETILFALLRQQAGSMKVLEMKIDEYEQKVRDLMSPEGMEEAKKKFFEMLGFGGQGGGGMFGGMFE